MTSERSVLLG